jgi:hypothetical protein
MATATYLQLVIPVRQMPCVYYATKLSETVPWLPLNDNDIYIQSMLTAKTNLSRFLNGHMMNWSILKLIWYHSLKARWAGHLTRMEDMRNIGWNGWSEETTHKI